MKELKTCVIVSYWVGCNQSKLNQLLKQMLKIDAGTVFDLVVVCNGGDKKPLITLPKSFASLRPRIFNRENLGYNIGAWEYGWRIAGDYEYYLFMQDDCFLKKPGWVSEFEFRMSIDQGIGLLGESAMWDNATWNFIRQATDRDLGLEWFKGESIHPLDFYQSFMKERGIILGEVGTHLQTLVLFTSSIVLKEIGGFPLGNTYLEAVACEIAISRIIASKGYRISKVKDQYFALIGHSQWTKFYRVKMKIRREIRAFLEKVGIIRPKK